MTQWLDNSPLPCNSGGMTDDKSEIRNQKFDLPSLKRSYGATRGRPTSVGTWGVGEGDRDANSEWRVRSLGPLRKNSHLIPILRLWNLNILWNLVFGAWCFALRTRSGRGANPVFDRVYPALPGFARLCPGKVFIIFQVLRSPLIWPGTCVYFACGNEPEPA